MTAPRCDDTAASAIDRFTWNVTGIAAPAAARATSRHVAPRPIARHSGPARNPSRRRKSRWAASSRIALAATATAAPVMPTAVISAAARATVNALAAAYSAALATNRRDAASTAASAAAQIWHHAAAARIATLVTAVDCASPEADGTSARPSSGADTRARRPSPPRPRRAAPRSVRAPAERGLVGGRARSGTSATRSVEPNSRNVR